MKKCFSSPIGSIGYLMYVYGSRKIVMGILLRFLMGIPWEFHEKSHEHGAPWVLLISLKIDEAA